MTNFLTSLQRLFVQVTKYLLPLVMGVVVTACSVRSVLDLAPTPQSELAPHGQISKDNLPNMLPSNYPIQSLQFFQINAKDGISQSVIRCLLEDKFGYIWIGTEDGLNKYDGKDFSVYKNVPDDPTSISYNDITAIDEAPDGTLWIGTNGGGVNIYSRETGYFTTLHNKSISSRGSRVHTSIP